jgi:hypothetical protein
MSQESPLRDEPVVAESILEVPEKLPTVQTLSDSPEIYEAESREVDSNRNEHSVTIEPDIAVAFKMPLAPSVDFQPSSVLPQFLPSPTFTAGTSAVAVVDQETSNSTSLRVGSIYRATPEVRNQEEAPMATLPWSDTEASSPRNAGVYPLQERRLLNMSVSRPIRWIWDTILALDAFLVSCLRCLFLLDPRRDHFRRRDY